MLDQGSVRRRGRRLGDVPPPDPPSRAVRLGGGQGPATRTGRPVSFHSVRSGEVADWRSANGGFASMGRWGAALTTPAESCLGVLKRDIIHVIRGATRAEATGRINDCMLNLHHVRRRRAAWRVSPRRRADRPSSATEPDLWQHANIDENSY